MANPYNYKDGAAWKNILLQSGATKVGFVELLSGELTNGPTSLYVPMYAGVIVRNVAAEAVFKAYWQSKGYTDKYVDTFLDSIHDAVVKPRRLHITKLSSGANALSSCGGMPRPVPDYSDIYNLAQGLLIDENPGATSAQITVDGNVRVFMRMIREWLKATDARVIRCYTGAINEPTNSAIASKPYKGDYALLRDFIMSIRAIGHPELQVTTEFLGEMGDYAGGCGTHVTFETDNLKLIMEVVTADWRPLFPGIGFAILDKTAWNKGQFIFRDPRYDDVSDYSYLASGTASLPKWNDGTGVGAIIGSPGKYLGQFAPTGYPSWYGYGFSPQRPRGVANEWNFVQSAVIKEFFSDSSYSETETTLDGIPHTRLVCAAGPVSIAYNSRKIATAFADRMFGGNADIVAKRNELLGGQDIDVFYMLANKAVDLAKFTIVESEAYKRAERSGVDLRKEEFSKDWTVGQAEKKVTRFGLVDGWPIAMSAMSDTAVEPGVTEHSFSTPVGDDATWQLGVAAPGTMSAQLGSFNLDKWRLYRLRERAAAPGSFDYSLIDTATARWICFYDPNRVPSNQLELFDALFWLPREQVRRDMAKVYGPLDWRNFDPRAFLGKTIIDIDSMDKDELVRLNLSTRGNSQYSKTMEIIAKAIPAIMKDFAKDNKP